MIRRVMLDIETLGTRPGAVVFSVGAVEFTGGVLGAEFSALIDPRDAQREGLTVDADTVCWWLQRDVAAQAEAVRAWTHGQPLNVALTTLRRWIEDVAARAHAANEAWEVWGNAPTLDCALLHECYRVTGAAAPWRYVQERCYRTLKNLRTEIGMVRTGTHHKALDDARDQARHAVLLLEALGCADWEFEQEGPEGLSGRVPLTPFGAPDEVLDADEAAGDLRDEIVPPASDGRRAEK